MNGERQYLIVSLKKEDLHQNWLWFWKPDRAGYTIDVDHAGRYGESLIKGKPDHYDNRINCVAIPEENIEPLTRNVAVNPGQYFLLSELRENERTDNG